MATQWRIPIGLNGAMVATSDYNQVLAFLRGKGEEAKKKDGWRLQPNKQYSPPKAHAG